MSGLPQPPAGALPEGDIAAGDAAEHSVESSGTPDSAPSGGPPNTLLHGVRGGAWLRLVVFVGLAVHMQLGGVVSQVFHHHRPPTTMTWQMYAAPGRNLCQVSWFRADGGTLEPVDRLAVLGFAEPWKAPTSTKRLYSEDNVWGAAKALCGKLGREADVRADGRCGKGDGHWVPVVTTEQPMCSGRPPRPRRGPK